MSDESAPATFDPLTRTWSGPMSEPTNTAGPYSQMCVPHGYVGDGPCPECVEAIKSAVASMEVCEDGTHQGFCPHCGRCQCGKAVLSVKP